MLHPLPCNWPKDGRKQVRGDTTGPSYPPLKPSHLEEEQPKMKRVTMGKALGPLGIVKIDAKTRRPSIFSLRPVDSLSWLQSDPD